MKLFLNRVFALKIFEISNIVTIGCLTECLAKLQEGCLFYVVLSDSAVTKNSQAEDSRFNEISRNHRVTVDQHNLQNFSLLMGI